MFLAVAPGIRKNPVGPLIATGQALNCDPIFGPNHALITGIPMELQALLVKQILRYGQTDADPMGRPTGPEGSADIGRVELVRDRVLKGWPLQVRGGVDRELDILLVSDYGLPVLSG